MAKRYRVTLTGEEGDRLGWMISRGKAAARKLAHARVLQQADEAEAGPAWVDEEMASALAVSVRTVERVRQRFVEQGLAAALLPKPSQRIYERKLDGEQEAKLIALACSEVPDGKARWTLRLLAERMPTPGLAPWGPRMVEPEYVGHALARDGTPDAEKNELKPHLRKMWCIPTAQSAEFVHHMEDVLEVYQRACDPKRPVVCLDETSKQLIGEVRPPLPTAPGQVGRYDGEYVRNGVANLFMAGAGPPARAAGPGGAAGRLAAGAGNGSSLPDRLGALCEELGGRALQGCGQDRPGHGSAQHPHARLTL